MKTCPVCKEPTEKRGACSVYCKLSSTYGVFTANGHELTKRGQEKYEQLTGEKYADRKNKTR